MNSNSVSSGFFKLNRGEVRDAIRRDVFVRIAHLVHQLLFDRRNVDPATGSFVLANDKGAVSRSLNDWKADVSQVRDRSPIVLTIAGGGLNDALDDVTGARDGC